MCRQFFLFIQVEGSGTVADIDRFEKIKKPAPAKQETPVVETNGIIEEKDEASGGDDEAGPINENLFLDEDLDGLDDELNDLDL